MAGELVSQTDVRIERFKFGEIVISGERYTEDVIVYEDRVKPHWWRQQGHLLQTADLAEVLACRPESLIIGTGTQECMKVAPELVAETRKHDIELLAFGTRAACQTFNHLLGKRRIVAVLHLTC